MARPVRTTQPLLDVVKRLLWADTHGEELHGWQIMKDTKRTGPTVYGVLDRLEDDLQWITSYWEDLQPDENRPRRRLYRLTDEGRAGIRELLAERRPEEAASLTEPTRQRPTPRSPRRSILPDGAR
jgi:DNA-binding PadR family transcriptional regulator